MDDGNGVVFNMVYSDIYTTTTISNLTAGTLYSLYASAVNFNGEGTFSLIG